MATPQDFARALLNAGNFPVTDNNIAAVVAWVHAEGGHWANDRTFNPLNTRDKERADAPDGIQAYSSWNAGIMATLRTLYHPLGWHSTIKDSLLSDKPAAETLLAIVNEPEPRWGTNELTKNNYRSFLAPLVQQGTTKAQGNTPDANNTALVSVIDLWATAGGEDGRSDGYIERYKQLIALAGEVARQNASPPPDGGSTGQPPWNDVAKRYSWILQKIGGKYFGGRNRDDARAIANGTRLEPVVEAEATRVVRWIEAYRQSVAPRTPPLPDPFGRGTRSIPTPVGLPDPFAQRLPYQKSPQSDARSIIARRDQFGGDRINVVDEPSAKTALAKHLNVVPSGQGDVRPVPGGGQGFQPGKSPFALDLRVGRPNPPDRRSFGDSGPFRPKGPPADGVFTAPGFRPGPGAGPSVNVQGKTPSADGANPPASRSTSPSTQGTGRDNSGKSTGDLHVDRPDPGSAKSTDKPTETRTEAPTVVQGSVDGGTTEATVSAPEKAQASGPTYTTGTIVVEHSDHTVETYTPPKDQQPDPPKKDDDRPNPDDSSGGGGPRSSNDNPNPEDSGSGGGNPRAASSSGYRPADDDGSGGGRGGGRGGGPGGPRSYDAYPDPESSGGGNPRSRGEMPNPEDTGSPRGPAARIGNRTFGTSYGSGSGAL